MAADDFVDDYWNLNVTGTHPKAGPVRLTISCNKYFMNMMKPKDYDTNDDAKKAYDKITEKQAHVTQILGAAQIKKLPVSPAAFIRVELGKASPQDMEQVLCAGISTGLLSADHDTLQKWTDTYIGVDCTGFVSNYFLEDISPTGMLVGNINCPWFFQTAIKNNGGKKDAALIWNFEDVLEDDVLLWMNEAGHETKRPGHIALIYGASDNGGNKVLSIAESSGASDGQGHSGPRLNEKIWGPIKGDKGARTVGIGEGVIVIRPFPPTPRAAPTGP